MNYNTYIDHTILKATANKEDIKKICEEALKYKFASVCIQPCWINYAKELLNSKIKICTVIGFPLGANTLETKIFETQNALKNGADEIDMVVNIGFIKSNLWTEVEEEILKITNEVKKNNKTIKVIIETCYLTNEEKERISKISINCNVDFIKTSTGFGTNGATIEDVVLMKKIAGNLKGVKASGGIKTIEDLKEMINAGATRIGTSNGINLIQ